MKKQRVISPVEIRMNVVHLKIPPYICLDRYVCNSERAFVLLKTTGLIQVLGETYILDKLNICVRVKVEKS